MLKEDRNKLIKYFIEECAKSNIPFHLSEEDEKNIENKKVVPKKKDKKSSKVSLPVVPTAAELLGKDPSELNPPSEDPMNDLPGDVPAPPEYDDAKSSPAPPAEPAADAAPPEDVPAPAIPQVDPSTPAEAPPAPAPAISPDDPNAMPPADPNATPPGEDPNAAMPAADPNAAMPPDPNAMPPGGDPNAMGGMPPGMDPNAMGMAEPEEKLDPTQIGQVYIMKKIYARLLAVDDNLNQFSGDEYEELKERCTEAIELFQSVVTNFDQFKDKLDDIIALFQKLLTNFVKKLEGLVPKGESDNE